jgi:hypothetical protein
MGTPPTPDSSLIMEVDARPLACLAPGCRGAVVRHSLGGGLAVDRCTRCFRRYQLRPATAVQQKGAMRRMLDEFASWQDR